MNPYKKLLGNSMLFAIGNLGSKLISIILVPLYTYHLTTIEYGLVDIVTTTSNMLLPIISLSIYEAILRFIMDKTDDKEAIITNSLAVTFLGSLIILLLYPLLNIWGIFGELLGFMIIILILQAFQTMLSQFTRAIGKVKIFALNGILMTLVTGVMNIILLVYLDKGIEGYLLSIVISNIISVLFLTWYTKLYKYIKINLINKLRIREMLIYSIPLIPNAFMWWIMNASNRYFILFFVGTTANGLFAVANKIPSLLSMLNTIFFQAWQLSAIEEYNSSSKSKLYSEVFSYFSMVMFLGASIILIVLKPIFGFAVASNFFSAWEYVPFLLLSVIFSSFSGFLGTNYIAAKQTKGVFRTSIIGGLISIVSNFIFVPLFGTNGAGISTMISFFVIWILRIIDTKKFIVMNLNIKNLILNLFILFIQIFALYINLNIETEILTETFLFILLIYINKNLFLPIRSLLKKKRFNN